MWIWFIVAVVLLFVELSTQQLVSIWFSFSALITGFIVAFFPNMELWVQLLIFAILAVVAVVLTRPLARKLQRKDKSKEINLGLVIGKKAVVVEKIDNTFETGAIKIHGTIWTARSIDDEVIEAGEVVIFEKIEGNKAFVKRYMEG